MGGDDNTVMTEAEAKAFNEAQIRMFEAGESDFTPNRFRDFLEVNSRDSAAKLVEEAVRSQPLEPEMFSALNVLAVGAGGIGCELMHALAVSPLSRAKIWLVDLDTIDLTNLNRQFLFREEHIGKFKAEVAASEVKKRFPFMRVEAINFRIEKLPTDFYRSLHFIFLGLDSVPARLWINSTIATLYHEEICRQVAQDDMKPADVQNPFFMIDAGTEGYKSSVRRIIAGKTPCMECLKYQYPPRAAIPMCPPLENIPRIPEHCVLYVKFKTWCEETPFGKDFAKKPEGDNETHIEWIAERAVERAKKFKIDHEGIDFRFTQGVVKNVVPAVGFSNALVAAEMVNEGLKALTGFSPMAPSQIQGDGSCPMGMGSTAPMTWPTDDCPECSLRKYGKVNNAQLNPKLSEIQKAAWEVAVAGTPLAGKDMPKRLKCQVNFDLRRQVTISKNRSSYPFGDTDPTINDAKVPAFENLGIEEGRVCHVDFTIVEGKVENDDGINDINGKDLVKVLLCFNLPTSE